MIKNGLTIVDRVPEGVNRAKGYFVQTKKGKKVIPFVTEGTVYRRGHVKKIEAQQTNAVEPVENKNTYFNPFAPVPVEEVKKPGTDVEGFSIIG